MHLAYVDDSGDKGYSGSQTFCLACVLMDSRRWPDLFDQIIEFRRFLRDEFKLPMRAEVKANYLLQNSGPFRPLGLSEGARASIYKMFMRLQAKLELQTFAIVIRKENIKSKESIDPRAIAWEYMFQRLERFTTNGHTEVIVFHDEGEVAFIRAIARKARRAGLAGKKFGYGYLTRPARLVIEDPVARRSHENYFIQLADLSAYAAFRRLYPPRPRPVLICPASMWDEMAGARYEPANKLSGGPPGIVAWP